MEVSLRRVHNIEKDDSKEEEAENQGEAAKEKSENKEAPAEASSPSLSSLLSDYRPPEGGLDLSKSLRHVHVFR